MHLKEVLNQHWETGLFFFFFIFIAFRKLFLHFNKVILVILVLDVL